MNDGAVDTAEIDKPATFIIPIVKAILGNILSAS